MKILFLISFVIASLSVLISAQPKLTPISPTGTQNDFSPTSDMNINIAFNVMDPDPEGHGGAKGDGIADDAPAIQAWLNKIKNNILTNNNERGGALYFPSGVYKIGSTLKIPPRCKIFGFSGTITQSHVWNDEYYKHQPVVIKLSDGANCNMIEPYPINSDPLNIKKEYFTNFESVVIEGIALFGNRQINGKPNNLKGIYLPSNPDAAKGKESYDDYYRSNMTISNVLICNIDGYGFFSEKNNKEYYLENVISRANSKDGFAIYGAEDIYFHHVWAGDNGGNGFYFYRSGTLRFTNCDTWGSRMYGLDIEECTGFIFNTIIANNNFLAGVRITGSGLINFVNSVFSYNSEADWTNPTSPDVDLLPNKNNYGVFGLKFIGCRFGGMSDSFKSLYAVRENSTNAIIRANAFIGCTFCKKSFKLDICDPQVLDNYIFDGCTAGLDGEEEIYNPRSFQSYEEQNNIPLKKQNHIISIDNNSSDCTVSLPPVSSVPVGKEYIIFKSGGNFKINIVPNTKELINNETRITISADIPAYSQIKLINGGTQWIFIKSSD